MLQSKGALLFYLSPRSAQLTLSEEVLEVGLSIVPTRVAVIAIHPIHEGLVSAARVRRVVLREQVPHCTCGGTGLTGHGRVEGVVTGLDGLPATAAADDAAGIAQCSRSGGDSSSAFSSQSIACIVVTIAQVAVVRLLRNERIVRADGAVVVGEGCDGAL